VTANLSLQREYSSFVCIRWPSVSGSIIFARGEASGATSGGEPNFTGGVCAAREDHR
jgi:hypothetical protein